MTKEEIYLRIREGNVSIEEGLDIIKSYIYLRKNQEIEIIPPRNEREFMLFNQALIIIAQWSA